MESDEAKEKSQTNFTIVKESFLNVCSNTTAHALPNICRTNLLLVEIFWFILFLGGVGASIFYTYSSIYSFFQYPVSVGINKYEKNLENFPAVTICNINPFDSSNSIVLDYLKRILRRNNLSSDIEPSNRFPAIFQIKQEMNVLKSTVLADKLIGKVTYETGFTLESMLISCYFDGIKCNETNFEKFYSFEYGNCYTFNSVKNNIKTTSKYGPGNGLTMEIFTGFPGRQDFLIEKRGLHVVVHNNTITPDVNQVGIKIPVGYATDIKIKRNFHNRLPSPFSDCREDTSTILSTDSIYYKETLNVSSYSKRLCTMVCMQYMYIIPNCNCSNPQILLTNKNQTLCQTLDETICVEVMTKKFYASDWSSSCEEYCPSECDTIQYETEMCLSDYPTEYYYGIVSKQPNLIDIFSKFSSNITYDRFKKSILMVNVYYNDLSYTLIDESQALTFGDVLGVIGGQVGLFLGASILTFFEPIEFLIESIYKLNKRRKNKVQKF